MKDNQQRKSLHLKYDTTASDMNVSLLLRPEESPYPLVMYASTILNAIQSIVTLLANLRG